MKLIFMGTPDFCIPILDALRESGHDIALVVSMPDAPVGRKQTLKAPPVKEWAMAHGIEVFQPIKVRDIESIDKLKSIGADVCVVAAYGQILSKEALDIPRFGCLNVHGSLLPKYRGAAPIQWAIINGEEKTGVTIMQMDVGLDDGDILLQKELPIASEDTGGTLFDKLALLGGEAIVEALALLEKGQLVAVPQDESSATKVGKIDKAFGKIDFTKTAEEIERLVRGLSPWPGTHCLFRGKSLKILKVAVEEKNAKDFACGETVSVSKNSWNVAAREGILSIKKVQPSGKKPMEIEDFLRGYRVMSGEVLE